MSVRVSRPLCKYQRMAAREMGLVRRGRRGRWGGEINNVTLWTFYFYEAISRDLSRNLSRENAKPYPAAKIAASRDLSRDLC